MKHYRIAKYAFNKHDLVLGISDYENSKVLTKLKHGFEKCNPNDQLVPYQKNAMYAFRGIQSLDDFLFVVCELSNEDLVELDELGYKVYEMELDVYSSGFSKMYSTFFDDECSGVSEHSFVDFYKKRMKESIDA